MDSIIHNIESYREAYLASVDDPEGFWANVAENFEWQKRWDKVLSWDFKDFDVKWFEGAQFNITANCLDRHVKHQPDKIALIWEPNDPEQEPIKYTYKELLAEVCKAANMLLEHGVQKGDRVCIYLPMIPQLAISMLATARIGAVHSVVFAGFSARALADRIDDAQCKLLITADIGMRGSKVINLKQIVDEAIENSTSIERVIVFNNILDFPAIRISNRDIDWQIAIAGKSDFCPFVLTEAEDMLFVLYTSGSTGKPKGVVHTCAGYMIYAWYTFMNAFQYKPDEVFWCTADIGWITGHSYIVYGPLLAGATTLMFEGVPNYPEYDRFWKVIDRHQVNIFYTAPTAIRALMAQGTDWVDNCRLDSLRVIGSVGEPINEEAWHWYNTHVGKEKCPLVDTWWQTETGGIMISPLAGITPNIPTFATLPLPGIQTVLLDKDGAEIEASNEEGLLCIKFPWPGMIRTTYGDHARCQQTYFSSFPGYYFTGDAARRDHNGNYRIIGRVDDVINVSGHRLGTAEIENAINEHPDIIESAVVGFPHAIKGQGIYAFVIPFTHDDIIDIEKSVGEIVSQLIGPIARPDKVQVVTGLPKTRSGKIMRRILRKIVEGELDSLGDTSTLLDPSVVQEIIDGKR
ncbi:MAG: acetate--CoA ligase [Saprospiraceae bacterium]